MPKLSDLVLDYLAREGVRQIFLVTGGGAMHLNDSLSRSELIEPVCNSHEQASAIAAEAYARVSKKLGVAMVTAGPGATNAITGVAGAWLDSVPLLVLSGQVKRADRMFDADGRHRGMRQLGIQEVDIVSIVGPIVKYAFTVTDPLSIRFHLEKAVYEAKAGRPGPVWIDIPLDVQATPLESWDALPSFSPPALQRDDATLQKQIAETIAALNHSERPLLFVGSGITRAGAEEELAEFVRLTGIPVATTWCSSDLAPDDESLAVGRPGAVAPRSANFTLQNSDFLLAIGARLDMSITAYAPERLAPRAFRVMVDVDQGELEKLAPHIHLPIHADARDFLAGVLAQAHTLAAKDRAAWKARYRDWKARYPVVTEEHRTHEQISVYNFAEVLAQQTTREQLLVSGCSGSAIEMFLLAFPTRSGQPIYHNAGLGAMGYGLPFAIGACLAANRRSTVCVDADGGFQFNIQELETVRRLNLPIKFFILNNGGYASIRASQRNYFGSASIGCDEQTGLTVPDIAKVASAYGLAAVVISEPSDLAASIARVLEMEGPVVCDVRVIPDEVRAPRVASRQLPDGSLTSSALEDLWPFLDREELMANMIPDPVEA